jgi:hypothetical protein
MRKVQFEDRGSILYASAYSYGGNPIYDTVRSFGYVVSRCGECGEGGRGLGLTTTRQGFVLLRSIVRRRHKD